MRLPSIVATVLVLEAASAYAAPPPLNERDPSTPVGLFECRSKEGKPHKLKMSDLDFVLPRCPSAPAILVTDDGGIEFGLPFAEVAKRLGDPGRPASSSIRENFGTANMPATFELGFDKAARLVSVRRGVSDDVADQIAAYWGPSLPFYGGWPKRVWFNPKTRTRATLEDLGADAATRPGGNDTVDGHRFVLELRSYTPLRDLFGVKGPIQRDVIGKRLVDVEPSFPELEIVMGQKLDTASNTLVANPLISIPQTELDSEERTARIELVDDKIVSMTWDFGSGDEETQLEILAEVFRALGGAILGSEMPSPEKLIVTFKLPTGNVLTLTSSSRQYSYGADTSNARVARHWVAKVTRP